LQNSSFKMKGGICNGIGQPVLNFDDTVNWV